MQGTDYKNIRASEGDPCEVQMQNDWISWHEPDKHRYSVAFVSNVWDADT